MYFGRRSSPAIFIINHRTEPRLNRYFIVNVRKNLTFTIKPPADAHGFAREICRLRAAQIRRGKRQSKENFVVCYK